MVGGLGNTGDSQQVLPTNLSVSGRLPRLMGIENFRLRTRDNSSLSRSRIVETAGVCLTVTRRPSTGIYTYIRCTYATTTTSRISGKRGWLRWIRCRRRRVRRYEPIAGVGELASPYSSTSADAVGKRVYRSVSVSRHLLSRSLTLLVLLSQPPFPLLTLVTGYRDTRCAPRCALNYSRLLSSLQCISLANSARYHWN